MPAMGTWMATMYAMRLAEVVGDAAPEAHGGDDGGEVVVGEHERRRLAGDVRAAPAHGDADVGGLERGRVVHAVAGHGHHLARAPRAPARGGASAPGTTRAKMDTSRARAAERLVVERVELRPGDHLAVAGRPAARATAPRRLRVVAGDHHHADARRAALGDGGGDLGAHAGRRGRRGRRARTRSRAAARAGAPAAKRARATPSTRRPVGAPWSRASREQGAPCGPRRGGRGRRWPRARPWRR